jgi:CubicO group peptidase (beta-lactamase class C family)
VTDPISLLGEWPVGSVAAAWTRPDRSCATYGNIDAPFALASVTKPLFGYAVLVAAEEGTLPLERRVGHGGATIRHLLAHASGLGPERGDPTVAPETKRIYSNAGFVLLGETLAEAAQMPAAQYFREALCEPLGMNATWLEGPPAHGAVSTVRDLVRFCEELLRPRLIAPSTHTEATKPVFPDLDGVLPGYGLQRPNPWGLGMEIRGTKRPHWTAPSASPATYGHFGAAGTFLWVDPAVGRSTVCLTDTPFGSWATDRWPRFSEAVLADAPR